MTSTASSPTDAQAPTIDKETASRIADQLSARFKGDLIGPDHADYGRARLVWNAMIDRRPGLIPRLPDVAELRHELGRPGP